MPCHQSPLLVRRLHSWRGRSAGVRRLSSDARYGAVRATGGLWRSRSTTGLARARPEILEILAEHNVPATFFQCGANVDRLPEIAREVAARGHEIGNHSYSHPYLFLRSPGAIEEELRRAQEAIERHTGVRPAWFRAPYGARWFGLGRAQRKMQLTGVMWSAIGYDWNRRADEVVARMAASASNGAILCLHDGRELREKPDVRATVETVRRLVPLLLDRGYKFETIGRLLCPKT